MSVVPFSPSESLQQSNTSNNGEKKENPAACVFVASLNRDLEDAELKTSVYDHFLKWGPILSVKVFKDWLKRPYAFVQYESVDDSKQALKEAPSTFINGRHIRCEPARANRSICLVSLNQPFNKKHIANIMAEYGEIEDMNILQPHGKFHSIMIKFKYRDDALKAYMELKYPKNNMLNCRPSYQQWFVEWAAYLNSDNVYGVCGSTCRLDKHTVFVGNLPEAINEEDLFIKFTRYGHILDIHLICKPVNRRRSKKVFAFIKYQGEKETAKAIDAENGTLFKEKIIRVCYRQYPCYNRCDTQYVDGYQADSFKFIKMNNVPAIDNNHLLMPYAGYNNNNASSSSSSNDSKLFDNMTQPKGFAYDYNNNVYHTPASGGYYVDPYPTMVYYTYTPYNNPYTALVKNVGTNKHYASGNFHLPYR